MTTFHSPKKKNNNNKKYYKYVTYKMFPGIKFIHNTNKSSFKIRYFDAFS